MGVGVKDITLPGKMPVPQQSLRTYHERLLRRLLLRIFLMVVAFSFSRAWLFLGGMGGLTFRPTDVPVPEATNQRIWCATLLAQGGGGTINSLLPTG